MKKRQLQKNRVDILLVEQGYFESRNKATAAIMAGKVRVGADHMVNKASELWNSETKFILETPSPYVGRGALKLLPALKKYQPNLIGAIGLDIGASTGGFTDVLLQNGIDKIYAVDVGYGQLHSKIRDNPRVICLEKVNARYLCKDQIPEKIDIVTMDVSFISTTKIFHAIDQLINPDAWIFTLIKPQFEAEKNQIPKGGVIKSQLLRERIIAKITGFIKLNFSWTIIEFIESPIKGAKGNIEYMGIFRPISKIIQ